jgi:hypothetical protein
VGLTVAADSIDAFAGGEPAAAAQLRRALRVLVEQYAGTPLGRELSDVLAGRTDLRALGTDPEFATLVRDGMRLFGEQWDAASPEERTALVREGESYAHAIDDELRRR